ncbi:hypothetical protein DNTS_006359 [Danionella cerebrum]|uniref:Alpha-2-macroglobulin-like protein 1 n=1 Tax=Danionella cerebrum TaxID=2873325 RepID=A0A553Q5H8_9TELE|nr:hypothetical protein DNTS_006359 [Danionella translucida]
MGRFFVVTFPSIVESGSDATLCASLLMPNESVTMTVSLLGENDAPTQLFQQSSQTDFHRCFHFQAPTIADESVQKMSVVVQGSSFRMTEERKVMFRSYLPVTFIQTDKPIYNPGQTVNFRVVTMDPSLVPLDQMDVSMIRVGQWVNVSSTHWILELSFDLNPEAQVGMYTVKAFIGERMTSQVFEVKKYVLPKFDVTVKLPQSYSVGDMGLNAEVCGKYTYGQPVPGQALVQVCRDPFIYSSVPGLTSVCLNKTVQLNNSGCASLAINTSVFFNPKFEGSLQDSFLFNVTVTEDGTDVSMSKSASVFITFEIGKVTFVNLPDFYDYGSTVVGKARGPFLSASYWFSHLMVILLQVSAVYFNGTAIAGKDVYILETSQWPSKLLLNVTTDQNGFATFSLNTVNFPKAPLNLMASATPQPFYGYKSPYFSMDSRVVSLAQTDNPDTPGFSELTFQTLDQPLKCGSSYPVTIMYSFAGETGNYGVDIIYMVLSRGVIVLHSFQRVRAQAANAVTSGSLSFDLAITVDMAPVVQILAFCVLPSLNILAGTVSFETEACFSNKVSMQFSPSTAVPAEANVLTVYAEAGSLCGLSAVDKSVLIMESGRRLTPQLVLNLLPVQWLSGYPTGVEDDQECLNIRSRRSVIGGQAYEMFKSVGMMAATNLPFRPPQCLTYRGINYYRDFRVYYGKGVDMERVAPAANEGGASSSTDVTVRTYFPETWIWQLAQVGTSGKVQVPLTVPDTITTWEAEAFCLSPKGFGLAKPMNLTAFQPFFLELTLPYSIVRGESFELKATVFNYLSQCILVQVTPTPSFNFTLQSLTDSYSSCLCANGRKTFRWTLTATVLGTLNVTVSAQAKSSQIPCENSVVVLPTRGRVDVVTRSLVVLPEGVERTFVQSWLFCPRGSFLSEDVTVGFPNDLVLGSAKCSVSVLGDIMGRALKNLDKLLQMPSGCGEQNMIVLAPNIYILQYLEATAQLTASIRETAIGYLQSGYQGQLNYRHGDGSYSTFGYDESNTWLTTFVLRSFSLAKNYIFIDPNVLQSAKDWLVGKQGSDGCFLQQGTLYHNDMKGGVGDNITMTGYVVASLLELGVPVTDPVIVNGLSCLRPLVGNLGNTYTSALLAYTFSLAGESSTRSQLLNGLNNVAISEGTKLHWSQTSSGNTLAVEISSYVLLAVLTVQPVSTANLGYANRIVSWLVTQQNAFGGFSTTQDTVVALHALALYASKVFGLVGSSTVTVQSSTGGEAYSFIVNNDNRLLYQEKALTKVPGKFSVSVKGSACVSVQVACFYNFPTPLMVSKTLSVQVKVTGDCKAQVLNLMLNFTVTYSGTKSTTNMVLVDIKLLSGFTADTTLLGSSPDSFAPLVQRVDSEDDHVLVYLKEAPTVADESVQKMSVVVQGSSFRMTEERKVMFRSYLPVTFIQTDKPIYNPGQTEAQVGMYTVKAFIGERMTSQVFEVKKYVLPKFDVTVKLPQSYSVGDMGLNAEVCGKYTYGQPVPGQALVQVCRDPFIYSSVPGLTSVCLNKTVQLNNSGCASLALNTSVFFNPKFEGSLQDSFLFNVTVTEDGTVYYGKGVDMERVAPAANEGGASSSTDVTVRTYFPETWIWQLAQVGTSGKVQVPLTVPDTITTWEAEAFCLSPKGFGLAKPMNLTAFQPFFLELTLPYSIVRGESFELKATVFNYLSQCILVQVTPTPSFNFTLQSLTDSYSSCLCANGRKTFRWTLTATVLGTLNVTVSAQAKSSQIPCENSVVVLPTRGRVDVVTRSLVVLPEGVERTFVQSWLFCPRGSFLSEDVTVGFPNDLVLGSAKCSVSVLGDIMGRALKNLDKLLQMPSGCGEQNMIVLAPNIYILQYLEATAQLTASIRETAIGYLQSGYQGQLNYRHGDGSYSTFGYDESNTWLTTFVLRSFSLAKNYIFIDPNVLQSAKDWLVGKQGSDGCFLQQGTLYHNDIKGGVGDNITMTGYVVASLLELGVPVTDPVIVNGLSCLRPLVGNLGNTYTSALLAYTFSLAGESSTRSQLLNGLNNVAISEGTKLHWSQTSSGNTLAVEISSYVLLAVLTVQPVSTANLGYANRIVSWLVTQQNAFGGFSTTQDTVVALHALALYASKVFGLVGSSTVTVQSSTGGEAYSFIVNNDNRLLYQEKALTKVPGKFSVSVKGSACVSVQVACFYNVPTPFMVPKTLSVQVKVTGDCKAQVLNLMLNFTVTYSGTKSTTNMVLVDIKLLSGFTADTSLLGSSPDSFAPLVQRVDSEDDHVLVYLKEVPRGVPMSYKMQLKRTVAVRYLKPAVVNVYDYYQTTGSLCGLSAVDKSVLIMESGRRLTPQLVLNLLPVQWLSGYPTGVEDDQECLNIRSRRSVIGGQAYEMFKSVGMMAATNLPFRPPQCLTYKGINYYRDFRVYYEKGVDMERVAPAANEGGASSSTDVTVRTYFPETWIWQLAQVGTSGKVQVPLTVPDTITTWEAEAFCLSPKGFGLAKPMNLTAFQPFFLELTLPYSIVRGESFELKATVFNYLSQCILVQVTPTPSFNFTLQSLTDSYSSCLCANGRKTFRWTLTATVLGTLNVTVSAQAKSSQIPCENSVVVLPTRGRVDVVTRSLVVLPEGVERTFVQSWLFCPRGSFLSEDVTVGFPNDLVLGSAKCSVSVLGDIMGRALKNLDKLLQMPSGCGEQNMIVLAPNIYILQYLEATAQLTASIRETAIGYLQSGYQGQLNYRHGDGSYSTFGYDESNTWLTTFVLRSFSLAKNYIFIDPNVLQSAKDWLVGKQGSDGCFLQQGTLYHNDMKGGVGDNITMTGYVVASLLELGVPVTDPVIVNGLSCLRPLVGNLGNTYTSALLAYTFSLAGESSTRSQLLNGLNNVAISEGTKLHWSQTSSGNTLAVEISSYVLLAVLIVQPVSTANLGYANRIVSWLVTQQNAFGGFSTTQDTVVALHALALYASKVFGLVGSSTVTVQSSTGGEAYSFIVNNDNRLLYQEKALTKVPGKFSVSVKGSACVSVQVACFYNVPTPLMVPKTLSVQVKVTGDCKAQVLNLMLNFTVTYSGTKSTTNMVLVDIKLLSGFTADTSLLGSSPDSFAPLVQRVDSEDDHVLVYLKEVPRGVPMSYKMQLKRTVAVRYLKPAVVNVYDYYQTSDDFETSYTSPCL